MTVAFFNLFLCVLHILDSYSSLLSARLLEFFSSFIRSCRSLLSLFIDMRDLNLLILHPQIATSPTPLHR